MQLFNAQGPLFLQFSKFFQVRHESFFGPLNRFLASVKKKRRKKLK